jgi:hypothetical protein
VSQGLPSASAQVAKVPGDESSELDYGFPMKVLLLTRLPKGTYADGQGGM